MKNLLVRNIAFSAFLIFLVLLIGQSPWGKHLHSAVYYILGFYFLTSILIGWMMDMAVKDRDKFIILTLGGTVLRLIIAIFAMLTVVIAGIENEDTFIINFFVAYLLYLIFELIFVLSNLRPDSLKL